MVVIEVCVESVAGVRAARAAGAGRVELCSALGEGGLTPSAGLVSAAAAVGGIELVCLARPRAGDFLYSEDELDVLACDVRQLRALGAQGVAFGCLTPEGDVDRERCARLIEEARGLRPTFHRAFDHVRAPEEALELLIELGFERVLTSGQAARASEGLARIAGLVALAAGRIEVVAAGGVRAGNALELVRATGVQALHFSASERRESAMGHRNPAARLASALASEDYAYRETEESRVAAVVAALGLLRGGSPGPGDPRP